MSSDRPRPDPLVPAEVDLRGLPGFMLNVERLLASELVALGTPEECWAAVRLWCRAWQQTPPASLPDDKRILAAFAGVSAAKWRQIREMAMHGFFLCSDGRYYHRVLAEEALNAWNRRVTYHKRRVRESTRLQKWRTEKAKYTLTEMRYETPLKRVSTPPGNANETPSETRYETPSETRSETPSETRSETPSETRSETHVKRLETGTGTGTETENPETQTQKQKQTQELTQNPIQTQNQELTRESQGGALRQKTSRPQAREAPQKQPSGSQVWKSYCAGYRDRYGLDPPRNAKANALCKQLIERLGIDDAIAVAGWYPSHPGRWHVEKGHALGILVAECETLRTQWATGKTITTAQAREEDGREKRGQVWQKLIEEADGDEPQTLSD